MKAQGLIGPNFTVTEANPEYTGDIAHLPANNAVKFPHLATAGAVGVTTCRTERPRGHRGRPLEVDRQG